MAQHHPPSVAILKLLAHEINFDTLTNMGKIITIKWQNTIRFPDTVIYYFQASCSYALVAT
jgi:hypothetical protein